LTPNFTGRVSSAPLPLKQLFGLLCHVHDFLATRSCGFIIAWTSWLWSCVLTLSGWVNRPMIPILAIPLSCLWGSETWICVLDRRVQPGVDAISYRRFGFALSPVQIYHFKRLHLLKNIPLKSGLTYKTVYCSGCG
jgi:hypothetical protein